MKSLTKITLMFVFAAVLVFSGIGLISHNKDNIAGPISSLSAGPIVTYNDSNTWTNHIIDKNRTYSDGNGLTAETAYKISNADDLALMAYRVNMGLDPTGRYYELTQDIDLSEHYWMPIGNYRAAVSGMNAANRTFNGYFDGKDFKISGVYIGNPGNQNDPLSVISANLTYAGFFGYAAGKVENLNLECFIQNTGTYAGSIAGYANNLTINNCSTSGVVNCALNSGTTYVGGLIGYGIGSISVLSSVNLADLKANRSSINTGINCRLGGLIAYSASSSTLQIKVTSNFGNISSNAALSCGGFIADPYGTLLIDSSFNAGKIDITCAGSSYTDTGGFIGWAHSSFTILNSFVTGDINVLGTPGSTSTGFGGFVGWGGSSGTIKNCFFSGNIIINNNMTITYTGILIGQGSPNMTNTFYNTSASLKYNYGNTDITKPVGNGSGSSTGYSQDYLFSQDFVDSLNELSGQTDPPLWIYTGDFPTLNFDIRYQLLLTFIFHNGTGSTTLYQPMSGLCRLPSQPIYDEYSFVGWFENEDGTGFEITYETTVEELIESGIKTFHACWVESEKRYTYIVELYDNDNNLITDQATIDTLISGTIFSLDQNDQVSVAIYYIQKNANPEYRFLRFEINGTEYNVVDGLVGFNADYFSLTHMNGEEIVVKVYCMKRYMLSFLAANNATVMDSALIYTTILENGNTSEIRGFFERWLDAGSIVSIDYIVTPGKSVQSIFPERTFTLSENTDIEIVIGLSEITLTFEIDEGVPEYLLPRLESGRTEFTAMHATLETLVVAQSTEYSLIKYELYLDNNLVEYTFVTDANGYINDLNILALLGASNATEIKIKAVYERIASLSFSYINSSENMGGIEVYKDNEKIQLDENGKSDVIKDGDTVLIQLVPKTGYKFDSKHGFDTEGKQLITIDGQMKLDIEFSPVEYLLIVDNSKSYLSKETAKIDENIIINLKVGFGFKFDHKNYTLKLNETEIEKEYIKVIGNSLVVNLSDDFIKEYNIDSLDEKNLNFNLEFSAKMSGLFIATVGGGSAILLAAAILIIIYVLALKKRKEELKKAEETAKIGLARLNVSDTVRQLMEED